MKPALRPLTGSRFEMFEVGTRTVHMDGFIEVEGAYYPVPHHLLQQEVRVRWNDRLVRVFHDGREVRVHAPSTALASSWRSSPGDRPAHKPARQQAYQENLLGRTGRVGDKALAWATAAIEERDVRAYRLLQGMLSLTRSHPKERVDWACGVASETAVSATPPCAAGRDRRLAQLRGPAPADPGTRAHPPAAAVRPADPRGVKGPVS